LAESDKGFLGVTPRNATGGVELIEVTPEGAADKAGLKAGDVIVSLNAIPIVDVSSLVTRIKSHKAGDQVQISFRRQGLDLQTEATLDGWNRSATEASRFKMMNRLGAIPSKRANDLPWVFQHDSPIFPEDCGGPVFDLEGNAIGLNIARQGRVASLGLPTRHLKTIISELQRENIASREGE
jgi:serine protease Do